MDRKRLMNRSVNRTTRGGFAMSRKYTKIKELEPQILQCEQKEKHAEK